MANLIPEAGDTSAPKSSSAPTSGARIAVLVSRSQRKVYFSYVRRPGSFRRRPCRSADDRVMGKSAKEATALYDRSDRGQPRRHQGAAGPAAHCGLLPMMRTVALRGPQYGVAPAAREPQWR
jgi:hypothetical protein